MGTTQTALRGENPTIAYVLVIEGYEYLLTSGSTSDCVTAWAATQWSKALPGLQVSGSLSQSLAPWSNELNVRRMSFAVLPDAADTFGTAMFKAKPSVRSELTTGFGTDTSGTGSFNIDVQDATPFSSATTVFIGNEAFAVTGASGTTIPVDANGSGVFSPFSGDVGAVNTFPGPHNLAPDANVASSESSTPVYVTDAPPSWLGKKVGLYVHRISNGVWDTKAQAEIWFAGTITSVSEDGLNTLLECDGITQALEDAILMHDQWIGRVKGGHTFLAGDWVSAVFQRYSGTEDVRPSARLTAVASSPGADEFLAGRYTAQEFASLLAEHLDGDATVGAGSAVALRWSAHVVSGGRGPRFVLTAQSSGVVDAQIYLATQTKGIFEFLGFENILSTSEGFHEVSGPVTSTADISIVSEGPPFHLPPIGVSPGNQSGLVTLEIEDTEGVFFDHTAMLPPVAQEHVGSGEVWSFYSFGDDTLFLGRRDSDTQISGIQIGVGITKLTEDKDNAVQGLRMGEGGSLNVKQVFFATGEFSEIISKLFASIDGKGHNTANLDVLPWGAGIPWSLLGQNFTDSLTALNQAGIEDSLSIMIEKPTRLWDAIRSDFALRMAAPVWKDGGIQIARLTVPNASTAEHTLDETNKSDEKRSQVQVTSEFLAHTIKIETNRNPLTEKFQDHLIVRDRAAYEGAGGSGVTKTIKARNSYVGMADTGASAEALGDMLAATFLPVFAKPLKRWKRSINHRLFHIAPGDTVTVTDDFLRDPATGIRGVTARPGIVLSVSTSFGIASGGGQTYFGEVDVLYTEEDRTFPLAPSCEHATATGTETGRNWTNGYDDEVGTAGVFSLLVAQHAFSDTTDANDVAGYAAGYGITITELDPADPASADSFVDEVVSVAQGVTTISAVTYDEIVLNVGFGNAGNPAFDGTKTYIVNYEVYPSSVAAQQLYAFQADDVGGTIYDGLADPNILNDTTKLGSADADITLLPSRYAAEQYGDGIPLSASFVRDQCRMANNLINYKTAPHMPLFDHSGTGAVISTTPTSDFQVIWTFPFLIGIGWLPGGRQKKLNVAPQFKSGGGTVTVRITSSANPPEGTTFQQATFHGPKKSVEFTTASTTSWPVATAQELEIVRAENFPDMTWITVEGNDVTVFKALPELWMGPIQ